MEIKIKMDKTAIIVSSVVGSLGLLAAILGFSAEGANSTDIPSPGLGICAAIFLLAAQITVSAVSGCGCCKSRPNSSENRRIVGIVCTVGSWIVAVVAFVLFVEGAAVNASGFYVKGGIYAGAGVLALATTALGITSFIMLRTQPADAAAPTELPVVIPNNKPDVHPQPVHAHGIPVIPQPHTYPNCPQPAQYPAAESVPHGNNNQRQDQAPPTPPAQGNNNPHSPHPAQANTAQQPATTGVTPAYVQPQVLNNGTLQSPVVEAVQVGVEVPVPVLPAGPPLGNGLPAVPPAAPTTQGNGLSTVIRNEMTRATIRLAGKAVEHALFSNSAATPTTTTGDGFLSMVTDPTAGTDVEATNYGDSAVFN